MHDSVFILTKTFYFSQKISHSQICLYLTTWRFELQVSACYGHHEAPLKSINIETLLAETEGLQKNKFYKIKLPYRENV
jgi:hypothetical protein